MSVDDFASWVPKGLHPYLVGAAALAAATGWVTREIHASLDPVAAVVERVERDVSGLDTRMAALEQWQADESSLAAAARARQARREVEAAKAGDP